MASIPNADKGAPQPPPPGYPAYPPPPPVAMPIGGAAPAPMYSGPPAAPATWVPPSPVPGMKIKTPLLAPMAGQVLVSYNIHEPNVGCCKCDTLSEQGFIAFIVLLIICPALAWIPCIKEECHAKFQRPVYGFPPAPPV